MFDHNNSFRVCKNYRLLELLPDEDLFPEDEFEDLLVDPDELDREVLLPDEEREGLEYVL